MNQGCWQGNHTEQFSALLQTLDVPRKEIAFGLCVPYHTLEKYFLGQNGHIRFARKRGKCDYILGGGISCSRIIEKGDQYFDPGESNPDCAGGFGGYRFCQEHFKREAGTGDGGEEGS